jgi:hypothetical protein
MKLTGRFRAGVACAAGTARNRESADGNAGGAKSSVRPLSFMVRPHPEYTNDPLRVEHLVTQVVLDIDASGTGAGKGAGKIAHENFMGRRILERIVRQGGEQCAGLWFKAGGSQLLRILPGVPGEKRPA